MRQFQLKTKLILYLVACALLFFQISTLYDKKNQFSSVDASLLGTAYSSSECTAWNIEDLLRSRVDSFDGNYPLNWSRLINEAVSQQQQQRTTTTMSLRGAEIGVYEGVFSERMLSNVPSITEYILVDPWKHLDDWNKPFNKENNEFQQIYKTAMAVTKRNREYGHKVTVMRSTSFDAAQKIEDNSLDFVYLDGDHTAKGAMKDLLLWIPKIKCGGLIFGDDYFDGLGKHAPNFDPTMVKSAVDAFTEVMGLTVYEMGNYQYGFVKR